MSLILHAPLMVDGRDTAMQSYRATTASVTYEYSSGFGGFATFGGQYLYGQNRYAPPLNSKDISLSMWFKPSTIANGYQTVWGNVINWYTSTSNGETAEFRLEWDGSCYKWFNNTHILQAGGFGQINVDASKFTHVVLTVSLRGRTATLNQYLDGILSDSAVVTTESTSPLHFSGEVILGNKDGTAMCTSLSDVRIYDHILSTFEINELGKRLLCHYTFDTSQLEDASGMGMSPIYYKPYNVDSSSAIGKACAGMGGTRYVIAPTTLKLRRNFSWNLWAKMTDWKYFRDNLTATTGQRFISCTETGGFNIECSDEVLSDPSVGTKSYGICVALYDSEQPPYNSLYIDENIVSFKTLSSGWHMFTMTVQGASPATVTLYIDGESVGSKEIGRIAYNSDNSIVLGGEATASTTSVDSKYTFNGSIDDFRYYGTCLTSEDVLNLYMCRAYVDRRCSIGVGDLRETDVPSPRIKSNGTLLSDNFCENIYLTTDDGAKFLKVFMHNVPHVNKWGMFSGEEEAERCYSSHKFSRLEDLKLPIFKNSDGQYEFLLRYEDRENNSWKQNRWKQLICPFDYTKTTSEAEVGYSAVSIEMSIAWGGSTGSTPSDGKYCGIGVGNANYNLLSYRPHNNSTYNGIASYTSYQDTEADGGGDIVLNDGLLAPDYKIYNLVELYVRVDNTQFNADSSISKSVTTMNEFKEG